MALNPSNSSNLEQLALKGLNVISTDHRVCLIQTQHLKSVATVVFHVISGKSEDKVRRREYMWSRNLTAGCSENYECRNI